MKRPKGHKKSCGCPFCKAYRRSRPKRARPKVKKSHGKHHKTRKAARRSQSSRGWIF